MRTLLILLGLAALPACGDTISDTTGDGATNASDDLSAVTTDMLVTDCVPACAAPSAFCNATHHCVACIADTDCPAGNVCTVINERASVCQQGCTSDDRCGGGTMKCCGMHCIDTGTDVGNCGGCGMVCSGKNTTPTCSGGACMNGTCTAGWGECNNDPTDGCETALHVDPSNCGKCGNACKYAHGTAGCADTCYLKTCDFGYDNCDGDDTNGCEKVVLTDSGNCGACNAKCPTVPHASYQCINAACQLTRCDQGFTDCNNNINDGCEVATATDAKNCGKCGAACGQGLVCVNGGCTCPQCNIPNAKSVCINNQCTFDSCIAGFGDCDNNTGNGCEININFDPKNCGSCGFVCPQDTPFCDRGNCAKGCFPNGSRAPFNTLANSTATGCWKGNPCGTDMWNWNPNNGINFQAFGQAVTCSGNATCVGNVGIVTYSGAPLCQGAWTVLCDGQEVGTINTIGGPCIGSAMQNSCKISFVPRTCSAIQLVAAQDNDNTTSCCTGASPDSMLTGVSAW